MEGKAKATFLPYLPTTFIVASIVILILSLTPRDPGCVEAYHFDQVETFVEARPASDGIFGSSYNDTTGGETAAWHPTGVRTNGDEMIFEVRGTWGAWGSSSAGIESLPVCRMCAKKENSPNCICDPTLEDGNLNKTSVSLVGNSISCTSIEDQKNPLLCSCSAQETIGDGSGIYYIATDYQSVSESLMIGDNQQECRYTQGSGLYVGLFGQDGNATPNRAYHMYSTDEICDIIRNVDGECVDEKGVSQLKYVYRSPNGKIFEKTTGSNPEPHKAGEYVKLIISDRYYSDNSGGYGVEFVGGFIRGEDVGLLEYVVGSMEDIILGKVVPDEDNTTNDGAQNKRVGGAIEYLYNIIVKDSIFILLVQMCLILYITVFGIFVLAGSIELSRKEFLRRLVKISLVIFFTTETSWYFYNQIVVGFFKDAMDYVISLFMTMSDNTFDQTSLVIASQLDRIDSTGHATRFAYVDILIKKLFSASTSKKILSLVLESQHAIIAGILYVMAIYALIFGFFLIMLTAAVYYIRLILGLVFVLALGPIFMITILFDKTDEIFKRWLAYMAAQSLQIVSLFLVLYLFAVLLDKHFTDLLYYRACTQNIAYTFFAINPYVAESNRLFADWIQMFVKIGALLYLLKMIIAKLPGFIGSMVGISFNGKVQQADTGSTYFDSTNASLSSLSGDLLGKGSSALKSALSTASPYADRLGNSMGRQARSMGLTVPMDYARNKAFKTLGVRGLITMYNDGKVDALIKSHKDEPLNDQALRAKVLAEAREKGISDEIALRRLERKLVVEPLKKAVKDQIALVKKNSGSNVPLTSEEMTDAIRGGIRSWAEKDSSRDADRYVDLLEKGKFKEYIDRKGTLSSSEALALAHDKDFRVKYLASLQGKTDHGEFEKKKYNAFKERLSYLKGGNSNLGADRATRRFIENIDPKKSDWQRSDTSRLFKPSALSDKEKLIMAGVGAYVRLDGKTAVMSADQFDANVNKIDQIKIDADLDANLHLDERVKTDALKAAAETYNKSMQEAAKQQAADLETAREMALLEQKMREQEAKVAEESNKAAKEKEVIESKERADKLKLRIAKHSLLQEYLNAQSEINSIRNDSSLSKDDQDKKIQTKGLDVKAENAKSAHESAE